VCENRVETNRVFEYKPPSPLSTQKVCKIWGGYYNEKLRYMYLTWNEILSLLQVSGRRRSRPTSALTTSHRHMVAPDVSLIPGAQTM